jgi:hypothetical protein
MNKLASSLVAAWLFAGWAAPCAAAPVTFDFTGSVTSTAFDPADPFGGAIAVGTTFSGSYTFDSTAANTNFFPNNGTYNSLGAPYGFNVTIGSFVFSTSAAVAVNIADGASDQYGVAACAGPAFGPFCFGTTAALLLNDADGTALTGVAQPEAAPMLSLFELAQFSLAGAFDGNNVEILGQLESLVCSAGCEPVLTTVPEPGTLLLTASALTAMRLRRRRRAEV